MEQDVKYLGVPNICFSLTEEIDAREKAFSKQRKTRGFDDSETWSLDSTISRFILPRLKVFDEITCGVPCGLTPKQWHKILRKMIEAFELIIMDGGSISFSDKERAKVNEGLDLFRKWFLSLWW